MIKINIKSNQRQWKKIGTRLERMALRVEKSANSAAISQAATPMLKSARKAAPRKTGRFRKGLVKRMRRVGGVVIAKIGAKRGSYSNRILHLLEFGTRKMPAQSFLRLAYYQTREESKRIYKRVIGEQIQKFARRERAKAGS